MLEVTTENQVPLFDECGNLIGVIERPVLVDPLGPGREKVYLARKTDHDARQAA